MSPQTQYQVAIEFGFPEAIVNIALNKNTFDSASSFIDYLEDYMHDLDSKTLKVTTSLQHSIQNVVTEQNKSCMLREETARLYRKTLCLLCGKNKRVFVTLPCSHFNICEVCKPNTKLCPVRFCR